MAKLYVGEVWSKTNESISLFTVTMLSLPKPFRLLAPTFFHFPLCVSALFVAFFSV